MRLDTLSAAVSDEQTAETWQEVLDVLNGGEMPPEDEKQPPVEELAKAIGALTEGLFEARKRLVDSRHVTLRRLNKREYANTIRDLLGVPVDTVGLPADGTVEGFDTIGDAHFMSTVQFEKYLELGRKALDMALVMEPKPERVVERNEPERVSNAKILKTLRDKSKAIEERRAALLDPKLSKEERQRHESRLAKELEGMEGAKGYQSQPAARTGFILDITQPPFGGQAHDKVRAKVPSKLRGRVTELDKADAKPTLGKPVGRYVARFRAGLTCRPESGRRLFVKVFRSDTVNQQISYSFPLGTFEITRTVDDPHVFEIPFENFGETDDHIAIKVSDLNVDANAKPRRGNKQFPDSTKTAYVWVDWLEVEGPFFEQWPPAAWSQTFFNGIPSDAVTEAEYAREVIRRFAFRAFRRRNPSDKYIDKLHAIFTEYRESGSSFVDSVKESLAVVLASPAFVYLVEQPAADEKAHHQLTDLELASRLSYFLWSYPPDAALFALAEKNQLSKPEVLREQVERMLGDPKAKGFIDAFTSQWLDLPWLDMIVVNEGRYPEFNEEVRQSLREECVQFFGSLIDNNLSVTNLIDSDFVMIDDVLASFYELDAGRGAGFRRVALPDDSPRGGLLGQGAILTMTSTGERTSPVERGVFVYERLLGRSVPPPPPNVPQLEISSEKPLTVRETLNAHIAKAQCASCHRRMDPLGFALEHFDAIGKWRDKERIFMASTETTLRGRPRRSKSQTRELDATGVMPDGKRRFDGHEQLKQHLRRDADSLASGLVRSMLTYALGRRVGFADGDFVEAMQSDWKKDDYRMRSLIHAIVASEEFQSK